MEGNNARPSTLPGGREWSQWAEASRWSRRQPSQSKLARWQAVAAATVPMAAFPAVALAEAAAIVPVPAFPAAAVESAVATVPMAAFPVDGGGNRPNPGGPGGVGRRQPSQSAAFPAALAAAIVPPGFRGAAGQASDPGNRAEGGGGNVGIPAIRVGGVRRESGCLNPA